jgi:hypothetical protein
MSKCSKTKMFLASIFLTLDHVFSVVRYSIFKKAAIFFVRPDTIFDEYGFAEHITTSRKSQSGRQRAINIGDDVIRVLDADRQSQ